MSFPVALRREVVRVLPYALPLLLCAALIAARVLYTGTVTFAFLSWNLFLAALPLAASAWLRASERSGVRRAWQAPMLALWLLFLPNAPYMLTDLLHLRERAPVPMWYDLALLLACAGTALALGYRSLLDVEGVVARWTGPRAARALAVGVLFLSGFGIYLGRFLRLNSWEAVTDPLRVVALVADRFVDPAAHPRTWGVTLLFGTLLWLGYAALRPHAPAAPVPASR